jgi:hypothetical protein
MPPVSGQFAISAWKASTGDRPNTTAHRPNDDTRRKSCMLCARSQIGYLAFALDGVVILSPRFFGMGISISLKF